jgi:hypothetical protein
LSPFSEDNPCLPGVYEYLANSVSGNSIPCGNDTMRIGGVEQVGQHLVRTVGQSPFLVAVPIDTEFVHDVCDCRF